MNDWRYLKTTNVEHARRTVMQLVFLGYSIQSLVDTHSELYTKVMVNSKDLPISSQDIVYILIDTTDQVIINFIGEESGRRLPSNLLRSTRHSPGVRLYYDEITIEELTGENV